MSKILLDYILDKRHYVFRKDYPEYEDLSSILAKEKLSPKERMTRRFELLTSLETPVLLPDEKIAFMRTVRNIPDCFTKEEWEDFKNNQHIFEFGYMSNLAPDYEGVIKDGLLKKRDTADKYGKRTIDAIILLSDRYREEAIKQGNIELAKVLERVPRYGAESFYEALQFFRIIHFSLWLEGNYHNTVGRFDKYMYPYLKNDMEKGTLDEEGAYELVEDFFLSFNKDNDLYPGIQQGDNGQSMVLGGIDESGGEVFNILSRLSLKASKNLKLIDPKINLRVSKKNPLRNF